MVYLWNMVVTSTTTTYCRYIWRSRNGARRRLWGFWMECMVILFSDLWQRNFNEDPKFSSRGKGPNVGMWQANGAEGNVFSTYSPMRRSNNVIHYLKMESTFEFWSFLQVQDSTQRLPKISCQMTCVQPPNGQDGLNVQPHAVKAMNWEQEGSLTAWAGKNVRTLTRQNVRIVQELSLLLALKAPKSPACWQVLIVLWLHGANGHLAPFPVVSSKIFLMYSDFRRNLHFIKYENSKIGWLLHYESL